MADNIAATDNQVSSRLAIAEVSSRPNAENMLIPDDLVRIIDPLCIGAADAGGGIVEGVESIDWHDTDSSLAVSLAESADRKAEPVSNVLSLSCIPRAAHNAARTTWIAVVPWTRRPWQ
jgi:hypothetical protein